MTLCNSWKLKSSTLYKFENHAKIAFKPHEEMHKTAVSRLQKISRNKTDNLNKNFRTINSDLINKIKITYLYKNQKFKNSEI